MRKPLLGTEQTPLLKIAPKRRSTVKMQIPAGAGIFSGGRAGLLLDESPLDHVIASNADMR